jgi:hypothetical protein
LVKILGSICYKYFFIVARPPSLKTGKGLGHSINTFHFNQECNHENPHTKEAGKGIFNHEKELILSGETAKTNLEGKKDVLKQKTT